MGCCPLARNIWNWITHATTTPWQRCWPQVLRIQENGNAAEAGAFVDRYAVWDSKRHGRLAQRLRDANPYRFRMVHYRALDSR